ncbi:MAG: hypothetical protein ACI8XC_004313 [Gammaproteobacteria bacterium]|jgi:hypothetical protein|tara:strand:- start:412 stop:804 length:393 start_codon:yes stop_codon:yes gene_type:complete
MFASTQMPAISFGFPDVCLTPTPVGPIPIPYPNIAVSAMAIPTIFNQFTCAMPDHNLATVTPLSNGDNAGVAMGVASGLVMGPSRHMLGSFKVFKSCMPATTMLKPTIQNSTNAPGISLSPSQIKVLIMA